MQKLLLEKIFGSTHTNNRIYLLWNCFLNYVYLKDAYISLKGIGKILSESVLRILLICNFTVVFTEKNLSKVSVQYIQLILPFIPFEKKSIVYIRVSTPVKNTSPLFRQAHSQFCKRSKPPFLGHPPL